MFYCTTAKTADNVNPCILWACTALINTSFKGCWYQSWVESGAMQNERSFPYNFFFREFCSAQRHKPLASNVSSWKDCKGRAFVNLRMSYLRIKVLHTYCGDYKAVKNILCILLRPVSSQISSVVVYVDTLAICHDMPFTFFLARPLMWKIIKVWFSRLFTRPFGSQAWIHLHHINRLDMETWYPWINAG